MIFSKLKEVCAVTLLVVEHLVNKVVKNVTAEVLMWFLD